MSKIRYLDKTGLKKVLGLLKFGHKKIWHGTQDEWDALSAEEKDKYDQAEIEDQNGITAVDKVEADNMNPVTSNAVAGLFVTGEYIGATNMNLPTSTPVDYMKITLPKGTWYVTALAHAELTTDSVLFTLMLSDNADVNTGNVTVDQRTQVSGIWKFVTGFNFIKIAADTGTVYMRLMQNGTSPLKMLDGRLFAIKIA